MSTDVASFDVTEAAVRRDELRQEARALARLRRSLSDRADPDAMREAKFLEGSFFRDVVAYLEPSLKLLFRSEELELVRRTTATRDGRDLARRFVVRSDGTLIKYDEANNADLADPVEFLDNLYNIDDVLEALARALDRDACPLSFAAAREVRALKNVLVEA